jgi:hypothetical protein
MVGSAGATMGLGHGIADGLQGDILVVHLEPTGRYRTFAC